jgi:hypothetical protein
MPLTTPAAVDVGAADRTNTSVIAGRWLAIALREERHAVSSAAVLRSLVGAPRMRSTLVL